MDLEEAVKTQEVIDRERVKAFYEQGHPIPGVTETQYIQISEQKNNKAVT